VSHGGGVMSARSPSRLHLGVVASLGLIASLGASAQTVAAAGNEAAVAQTLAVPQSPEAAGPTPPGTLPWMAPVMDNRVYKHVLFNQLEGRSDGPGNQM